MPTASRPLSPAAGAERPGGLWALLLLAAMAVFWPATVVGGALQPGYRAGRDVISTLAAYGVRFPAVGIVAIAILALGHGAFGIGMWRSLRATAAGMLVIGSAVAGLLVAGFRIHCPGGAAGCRNSIGAGPPRPFSDVVHGYAVSAYALLLVLGMLAYGVSLLRSGARGSRWLAAASVAFGLASITLASGLRHAPHPGAQQRAWLAVNSVWGVGVSLLLLARRGPRSERLERRSVAWRSTRRSRSRPGVEGGEAR